MKRIGSIRRRVNNRKDDWIAKTTTRLVEDYDLIALEALNPRQMTRKPKPKPDPNHKGRYLRNGSTAKAGLNRSILNNRWTDIQNKLEYKTRLAGTRLILVNPAYTSQTCNRCGHVAKENRESQAVFQCVNCGNKDNADINAAKNILSRAIHTTGMDDAEGVEGHASRETNVSWESPVETPTPAPRMGRPLH